MNLKILLDHVIPAKEFFSLELRNGQTLRVIEMDSIVAISNCPQDRNPCNAFNPSPIRAQVLTADI
jgi:uncharacterized protein YcgI (DUF1989 family)